LPFIIAENMGIFFGLTTNFTKNTAKMQMFLCV
jgi:hypothetical protein